MPVASIAWPITPPRASISRTRCPLAVPPTAGLHGMCAIVSRLRVQIATAQPRRAAACAASTPAWPAPITMTSNFIISSRVRGSFSDTEPLEDMRQQIVGGAAANDFVEGVPRRLEVCEDEFFGRRSKRGASRCFEMLACALQQRDMSRVGDRNGVAQRLPARQRNANRSPKIAQAVACHGRHADRLCFGV